MQTSAVDLIKGVGNGSLTKMQMALVTCFAPDRVNECFEGLEVTPLHMAACLGHNESMELLLTAKANPDAEGKVSTLPTVLKLRNAELCVNDWCRTSVPRYTRLLRLDKVGQYSCYLLQRVIRMLRTR